MVQELARDGKLPISFHIAHGWGLCTNCDEIDISKRGIGSAPIRITPDGTGFKGEGCNGEARKGDLKVVIGINTRGEIFPFGTWAGKSWDAISKQWNEQKMKFPDGSILICDGEPGLSDAFPEYALEQQRCHWHIELDLYYAMYQDGGRKVDSKPIQEVLAGALAIELPLEDFKAAATYLRRAKIGMIGYIRHWLKWGLISPGLHRWLKELCGNSAGESRKLLMDGVTRA